MKQLFPISVAVGAGLLALSLLKATPRENLSLLSGSVKRGDILYVAYWRSCSPTNGGTLSPTGGYPATRHRCSRANCGRCSAAREGLRLQKLVHSTVRAVRRDTLIGVRTVDDDVTTRNAAAVAAHHRSRCQLCVRDAWSRFERRDAVTNDATNQSSYNTMSDFVHGTSGATHITHAL
jgi:hypothetical protein